MGQAHRATPREIVGAIANEAGLEGQYIGSIEIHPEFSLVDLPEGMPKEIYRHLRKVMVCGRPLKIRLDQGPPPRSDRPKASAEPRRRPRKPGRHKPAP